MQSFNKLFESDFMPNGNTFLLPQHVLLVKKLYYSKKKPSKGKMFLFCQLLESANFSLFRLSCNLKSFKGWVFNVALPDGTTTVRILHKSCTTISYQSKSNFVGHWLIVKCIWDHSIWRHRHFDNFVTTHLSHQVITKLGIPYLPTCHQLSSLREAKKRTNK